MVENYAPALAEMDRIVDFVICHVDRLFLCAKSKEISDNVAGFVAFTLQSSINDCCGKRLFNEDNLGGDYHSKLSRGGLVVASDALQNYVATGFAILDVCEMTIHKSGVPPRKAAEHILKKYLSVDDYGFTCTGHESEICSKVIRKLANVFLNNKRKCLTETVTDDRVKKFKSVKRDKRASV